MKTVRGRKTNGPRCLCYDLFRTQTKKENTKNICERNGLAQQEAETVCTTDRAEVEFKKRKSYEIKK